MQFERDNGCCVAVDITPLGPQSNDRFPRVGMQTQSTVEDCDESGMGEAFLAIPPIALAIDS